MFALFFLICLHLINCIYFSDEGINNFFSLRKCWLANLLARLISAIRNNADRLPSHTRAHVYWKSLRNIDILEKNKNLLRVFNLYIALCYQYYDYINNSCCQRKRTFVHHFDDPTSNKNLKPIAIYYHQTCIQVYLIDFTSIFSNISREKRRRIHFELF